MSLAVVVLAQASMTRFDTAFVRYVDAALGSPILAVVALGVAFGVGALHALAPGHGKTITAAYLVGSSGRPRDAALLGVVVAAMHTASVLVLGVGLQALLTGSDAQDLPALTEDITPALRIVSGLIVTGLGVYMVWRQLRRRSNLHHHVHAAAEVAPLSRRGLVALGMSGGLLPSPSAFLVLATTSFTGRLWFGLLLVVVFSIGLATTLTALGLAVVWGRATLLERLGVARGHRLGALTAMAGAALVLLGGLVMTVLAVRAL